MRCGPWAGQTGQRVYPSPKLMAGGDGSEKSSARWEQEVGCCMLIASESDVGTFLHIIGTRFDYLLIPDVRGKGAVAVDAGWIIHAGCGRVWLSALDLCRAQQETVAGVRCTRGSGGPTAAAANVK
jgi:hypothetical protein